jgi:hypothetical protein
MPQFLLLRLSRQLNKISENRKLWTPNSVGIFVAAFSQPKTSSHKSAATPELRLSRTDAAMCPKDTLIS